MERFAQCLNIMAIDNNGMPAESLHACTIDIRVVFKSSWLALAQPMGEGGGRKIRNKPILQQSICYLTSFPNH